MPIGGFGLSLDPRKRRTNRQDEEWGLTGPSGNTSWRTARGPTPPWETRWPPASHTTKASPRASPALDDQLKRSLRAAG